MTGDRGDGGVVRGPAAARRVPAPGRLVAAIAVAAGAASAVRLHASSRAEPAAIASTTLSARVFLPFGVVFVDARTRATQLAAASRTPRASRTPSATATPTASRTATASPRPSGTTLPATATVRPSPSPPVATPVPGAATATTLATAAPPTATPTAAFVADDPGDDHLAPLAAGRSGATAVRYDAATRSYRFTLAGSAQPNWSLDLTHPDVQRGRISLRELASGRYPVAGAGLYYRSLEDEVIEPRLFQLEWAIERLEHGIVGGSVVVTVTERLEEVAHRKRYTLTPVGRAVRVRAQSLDGAGDASGRYAGFTAGDIEGGQSAVDVRVPYMDSVPVTFVDGTWFTSALLDIPQSRANALAPRGPGASGGGFANELAAYYDPDALGLVRAVDETVWLTWSTDVADAFPAPPGPVAPHRAAHVGRLHATVVDVPGAAQRSFGDRVAYAAALRALGVDDVVVHVPRWRDPAALPPAEWPPDPAQGGEAAWRALAASVAVAPSAAYTLTVPGCPDAPNPSHRSSERVTGRDGVPKAMDAAQPCPDGATTPRFLLPPAGAVRQAGEDAGRWTAAGAQGVTLDVLGAWNPAFGWPGAPDNNLDFDANPRHPGSVGESVAAYGRLFQQLQRQIGPVWADGAHGPWPARYDTFYLGYVDGVARSLSSGAFGDAASAGVLVVPDFALRAARPKAIAYGLGDVERFFGADRPRGPLSMAELDAWRATELAFGHAGAWLTAGAAIADGDGWRGDPTAPWSLAEEVKDYHLFLPLQTRTLDAPVDRVDYVGPDGRARTLAAALVDGLDLIGPRLVLRYGGPAPVTVWVNLGATNWPVVHDDTVVDLPPDGWLVDGADLDAYSALVDGRRVDFLRAPQWTLYDGRGTPTTFPDGATATWLRVVRADGRVVEGRGDGSVIATP